MLPWADKSITLTFFGAINRLVNGQNEKMVGKVYNIKPIPPDFAVNNMENLDKFDFLEDTESFNLL